ncbi:hypothetical protein LCGC14_1220650 [marine sediment metagenome]|uniref:O-antigen ligase-related domain-containing protein n=1 Tax=marine sediment metagenome TaxID=412755 RepID=A0A0F9LBC4_9ZZZZ
MKKLEPYILILGIFACALSIDLGLADIIPLRHVIWSVLVILLFLSISYRAIVYRSVDFSFLCRPIFHLFAFYLLFSVLSLVNAINISEGVYQILKIILWMVFVCELVIIEKKIVIKSLVLLAIIIGGIGVWSYFAIEVVSLRASTMGGKNLLSSALALLLPFCVYTLFQYRYKVISISAISIILFNIVMLQGRAVWLAITISLVVVLAQIFDKRKFLAVCTFVIASLCILCLILPDDKLIKVVSQRSLINRMQLYSGTWKMIKDNPLGVGIGNWPIVIQKYGRDIFPAEGGIAFQDTYYTRLHNDPLETLAETGPAGLVCILGIFAFAFYYSIKTGNIMALGGLSIFVIISLFSFPSERVFHPMMFAFFIAIPISQYHESRKFAVTKTYPATGKMYLASLAVLSVLVFGLMDFSYRYKTMRMVRRVSIQRKAGNFRDNIYELSSYPNWFATLDRLGMPIIHYKGEVAYIKRDYLTALEYYKMAEKYSPYNSIVLNNIGGGYIIAGENEKAIEYLEKALEINPYCKPAQRNMKIARERTVAKWR